jgi:hypothetical protein
VQAPPVGHLERRLLVIVEDRHLKHAASSTSSSAQSRGEDRTGAAAVKGEGAVALTPIGGSA